MTVTEIALTVQSSNIGVQRIPNKYDQADIWRLSYLAGKLARTLQDGALTL